MDWIKMPLQELPKSMSERALWARKCFIDNPEESEIDDALLVWCLNIEDGLWYSIAGNYSQFSPKEKRIKENQKQTEYENRMKTAQELAVNYYSQILYQSKIREAVILRDNNTCQKCLMRADSRFHIHHIHKRIEGGTDHLDNLIMLCPKCHKKVDTSEYNPVWKKRI